MSENQDTPQKTIQEMEAEHAEMAARIQKARDAERQSIVPELRAKIEQYGLTAADLFPGGAARAPRGKAASAGAPRGARPGKGLAKYKDPNSDRTWSGLGRKPEWVKGVDDLESLKIS